MTEAFNDNKRLKVPETIPSKPAKFESSGTDFGIRAVSALALKSDTSCLEHKRYTHQVPYRFSDAHNGPYSRSLASDGLKLLVSRPKAATIDSNF